MTGHRKRIYTIDELNKAMPINTRLTPIEFIYMADGGGDIVRKVKCKCICGNITHQSVKAARRNISCGCLRKEVFIKRNTKNYPVIPKLRKCYGAMIRRCYNKKEKSYYRYGGKGVVVCDEWKNNYQSFLDWSISNGYKDGLCLDKDIKGNGKLYSPETCCWVTNLENQSYKSNSVKFEYNGEMLTAGQIGRLVGVRCSVLYKRLIKGVSMEEAISKKVIKKHFNESR